MKFAALLLVLPFAFTAPAAAADNPPGFWITLKNACPGAAAASVGDRVCGVAIGTASFNRILQSGAVAPGFTAHINVCTGPDGKGLLQFSPENPSLAPAFVPVSPDETVSYPASFCKK